MKQNHNSSGDNVAGNKVTNEYLSKPIVKIIVILIGLIIIISVSFAIFSGNEKTGIKGNNNDNNKIIIK